MNGGVEAMQPKDADPSQASLPHRNPSAAGNVAVLISTYNGAAYLAAQLDSLAAQAGVAVEVFVRDDGSTDDTLAILARYAHRWPQLAAPFNGGNLGPAMSFLELLRRVPDGFDGYAFCDQDDVWLPDKLRRAGERLSREDAARPVLYCSSVQCVDRDLNALGTLTAGGDGRFEHILFENIAFGVTVVMNPAARALVNSASRPEGAIMHDWWCALVVSALGLVIHDERPGVLYRQHGANVVGGFSNHIQRTVVFTRQFSGNPRRFYPIHAQAMSLLSLYGDRMDDRRRDLTRSLVAARRSLLTRVCFAFSANIVRRHRLDSLAARALIALGLY